MPETVLITTSSFAKNDLSIIEELKAAGLNVILNPLARKLTEAEVSVLLEQHKPSGMIAGVEPLTRKALQKAKSLKIVSRCGIGLDNIDLCAADEFNIIVKNTPDAITAPVAELSIGLMLALLRKIHHSDSAIRKGEWLRAMGQLLCNKTVGIIGCGRIGIYVAKLLTAFNCEVLGYDPYWSDDKPCKRVDINELIDRSDIITLHIPYCPENNNFIDKKKLSALKKGAFIINAARGGLIDEDALYDALLSGHLGGAALDCFENEPYSGRLKGLNNTLLTAHIGSYAVEGRIKMERQAVENLFTGFQECASL